MVAVIVQIYGDRSAVLKTPVLRDELGVVGCCGGKRRTDDGVVQHLEVTTSELHGANVHQSRLNRFRTVVCVEDDAQQTLFVIEKRMVSCAYEVIPAAQDGVAGELRPSACGDVGGCGIAYGIVLAAIVVSR